MVGKLKDPKKAKISYNYRGISPTRFSQELLRSKLLILIPESSLNPQRQSSQEQERIKKGID
jgi:hypothetical protein